MNNKRTLITSLIGGVLLVSLMFILSFNGRSTSSGNAGTQKVGNLNIVSMSTISLVSPVIATSTLPS